MEKFKKYLDAFDGTAAWSEVRPLFDETFHPNCVFVTAAGEMNRAQWAEMAKGLAAKGATATDFEVTGAEGDAFYYKVTITVGEDAPMHLTAKGHLKDGQIIRVAPVDPAAYATMVERSR